MVYPVHTADRPYIHPAPHRVGYLYIFNKANRNCGATVVINPLQSSFFSFFSLISLLSFMFVSFLLSFVLISFHYFHVPFPHVLVLSLLLSFPVPRTQHRWYYPTAVCGMWWTVFNLTPSGVVVSDIISLHNTPIYYEVISI